nr:sigma factor-like helix-turn-helix DNA-binding protein [Kineosphaera limosa]
MVNVRQAVAKLSPQRRAVVFCRFYLDLSEAETARTLQVPLGTVKSRLSRAMRELEEALDD